MFLVSFWSRCDLLFWEKNITFEQIVLQELTSESTKSRWMLPVIQTVSTKTLDNELFLKPEAMKINLGHSLTTNLKPKQSVILMG